MKKRFNIGNSTKKKQTVIIILILIIAIQQIFIVAFKIESWNYKRELKIIQSDYTNSIYLILENQDTHEKEYIELNDRKDYRETAKFNSDDFELYQIRECSFSNSKKCYILNEHDEKIENDKILSAIQDEVKKIDNAFTMKIMKVNEEYFVVVNLNVNMWNPYMLYHFDNDDSKLKELYTFDNKDIIGISLKNKEK